jgi:LuxR family glucitol operon transcriptional activator
MAELEDRSGFAEWLSLGVTALRRHPDYKTRRKKREALPSGLYFSESYLDKMAHRLGISSNTIKSWIGQMGVKYIPSRIEDGKLFGIIWLVLEKSDKDIHWLTELVQTTSIPIISPALPTWVASCLKKAKQLRSDDSFGAPSDEQIAEVLARLFNDTNTPFIQSSSPDIRPPTTHNLPTRWTDVFIGRRDDLEAIRQWMLSTSPVCFITGWGGVGKTTLALESAYACVGEPHGEAVSTVMQWPVFPCLIWISSDLRGLSFSDFLDTIAYQLGRAELLDKSVHEKRFVVRNALANYSSESAVLLIIDNMDVADSEIYEFITNLPQRVKVMLTSREKQNQIYGNASRESYTIPLEGLQENDALDYLVQAVKRHILMSNSLKRREKLEQLLSESPETHQQLIVATAGNPKAMALSIAYIADDVVPVKQLIQEIRTASYSLTTLFEYLFGHTWTRCNEDTRQLWQVLSFFNKPPNEHAWAAAAGLDSRRFHHAAEQMRAYALIESEWVDGELVYQGHQTVLAYGEQKGAESEQLEIEARRRWGQYYIQYLDIHLKRTQPNSAYWNFLLGRDLGKVKQEWPNLLKLMEWAYRAGQFELSIELMTRLSHFMSRVSLLLRIEYGLKAADAAHHLEKQTLEALFRIDTAGWALIEMGSLDEGLRQIEAGLQLLEQLNPKDPEVCDLRVLGLVFKSRYYLKVNQPTMTAVILEEAMVIPSSPIIRHRVLLVKGDLCLLNGNDHDAIQYYEEANELSKVYGSEKTIEAYFNLGVAYIKCGSLVKAEAAFEQLLYDKAKANQIELIYYRYGMAQLLATKGDHIAALEFNQKALILIDSWEQSMELRTEIEQFNEQLKSDSSKQHK